MNKPYTGHLFFVTLDAMYWITIPEDLTSRPAVQKWSNRAEAGKPVHVGVTDYLRGGYTLGITSIGLLQYNQPDGHNGPPLAFEEIPGLLKGKGITATTPIVALFTDYRMAEECYEATRSKQAEMFDCRWWLPTKNVLVKLGTEHPLVTISVTQTKFGVSRFLWDEKISLPFAHLAKGEGS
jgi:hypothetical protein